MVRIPIKRSKAEAPAEPAKPVIKERVRAAKAKSPVAETPAPQEATPKKATPKKAAPKTSTTAATENKIPKVAALKCRALSDDQLKVWEWVEAMLEINPVVVHPGAPNERMEIRNVPPRSQVLFNTVAGVPCYKVYTQHDHCQKILAAMKKYIPKEMLNRKWHRRIYVGE